MMRFDSAFIMTGGLLAALSGFPSGGRAASFAALHAFIGNDGYGAATRLTAGANGVFFGVTPYGGATNCGSAFSLTPPAQGATSWTFAIIYDFPAWQTACRPIGPLAVGASGTLYGASGGGQFNGGTVFSLTPPAEGGGSWSFAAVHNFGATEGDVNNPTGGVVIGADGSLYGTVSEASVGAVYRFTPSGGGWTENLLYTSSGSGGPAAPFGSLLYRNGVLYGINCGSGFGSCAVVSLAPPTGGGVPWQLTSLVSLPAPQEGNNTDLIADANGALYGTTQYGGATSYGDIYRVVPPQSQGGAWTFQELYAFPESGVDGFFPSGGVTLDSHGHLWGVVPSAFDAKHNPLAGLLYRLTPPESGTPPWSYAAKFVFNGNSDGGAPTAGLTIATDGTLFGVTASGGGKDDLLFPTFGYSGYGYGVVFGYTP
jgi:uncharacterized repeat protein (TIGR03803 family)